MLHYCSHCGHRSYHGPGSWAHALKCPNCSHVERQHPHAPRRKAAAPPPPAPVVDDDGPVTATGTIFVTSGGSAAPDATP